MTALRALMIAPAMPADGGNGLVMRLGMFLEALTRVAQTDLIVLPVVDSAAAPPVLPNRLGVATTTIAVAGRRDTQFELLARLGNDGERVAAFRNYGRSSLAAYLSYAVLADLGAAVAGKRYDLIHVSRGYMAEAALAVAGGSRLTLDLDEDDGRARRSLAKVARGWGAGNPGAWMSAEAAAADRLLATTWRRFHAVFVSSPIEQRELRARLPQMAPRLLPNAVATARRLRRCDDGATLLFVGNLGHPPNVDGIGWFVERIWPRVRARRCRLLIAGRNMAPDLRTLAAKPGITLLPDVANLAPLYARATLAIAPLRAGGGTRIKLLEAAACGVPIVATSIAAEGLAFDRHDRAWIADGEAAFATAIEDALADPAARRRRAARAAALVRNSHARARVVRDLACQLSAASVT
jgi:glycosyltransferase involved in cell wall biosynthesis